MLKAFAQYLINGVQNGLMPGKRRGWQMIGEDLVDTARTVRDVWQGEQAEIKLHTVMYHAGYPDPASWFIAHELLRRKIFWNLLPVVMVLGAAAFFEYSPVILLFAGIMMVGLLAVSARMSRLAASIRAGGYVPWSVFLGSPSLWWPPGKWLPNMQRTSGPSITAAAMILIAGILFAGVGAGDAFAQSGASAGLPSELLGMEPPAGDISAQYIRKLFLAEVDQPSALKDIMTAINTTWLFFAGILAFFMMTLGLVFSATDGQFLGKKHSAVWVPLRFGFAFVMLLPPGMEGMSIVQRTVAQVAYYSIGAASKLWSVAIDSVAKGQTMTPPGNPNTAELFRVMLEGEVCRQLMNIIIQDPNNAAKYPRYVAWQQHDGDAKTVFSVDYLANNYLEKSGICGEISIQSAKVTANTSSAGAAEFGGSGILMPELAIDRASYQVQVQSITGLLQGEIPAMARDILNAIKSQQGFTNANRRSIEQRIYTAMDQYNKAVAVAIKEAAATENNKSISALKLAADSQGWSSAGSYFLMVTRINGMISNAAMAKISGSGFLETQGEAAAALAALKGGGMIRQTWAKIFGIGGEESLMMTLTEVRDITARVTGQVSDNLIREAGNAGVRESDRALLKSLDATQSSLLAGLLQEMSNGGEDSASPFESNIAFGHKLIWSGYALVGGSFFGKALEAIPVVRGVQTAIGATTGINAIGTVTAGMQTLGFALLFAGIVLAYVMPLLPAIFWILGIVGYMILVLEAILAAPLWMLGHLRLDGEGLAGPRGTAGYELALNLIIRPCAMVVGLIVAIIIYQFGSMLISMSMLPAIVSAAGGHYVGVTGVVVWAIMTAIISVMLTFIVFKESLGAADHIVNWVAVRANGGSDIVGQAQQMGALMGYGALNSATTLAKGSVRRLSDESRDALRARQLGGERPGAGAQQDVNPKQILTEDE